MSRKAEHKILSFTTTMRNPERIAGFLNRLKQFDGKVLTNDLIYSIVKDILKQKLYHTMYIKRTPYLKSIYENEEVVFSDKQLDEIILNSPQNHKEAGFEKGWPSRFDTWFQISKEFGFVYYKFNEPIHISQTGYMLCNAFQNTSSDEDVSKNIQNVFLNALIKYPSNNPFRKNANQNIPVLLLMKVIKLLKADSEQNDAGISRKEIPFILCWPDNSADRLFHFIKEFRSDYGLKPSDDKVYEHCLSLLNSNNEKRFKKSQVVKESVDDFLRKIRITGIFSLRGMGRFIDFNKLEHQKISYILQNYGEYKSFDSDLEYFDYMGSMDSFIVSIETDTTTYNIDEIRKRKLIEISSKYSSQDIIAELELLSSNRKSNDQYFSDIDEPTRLEFLTSISLQQHLNQVIVEPHYNTDDEGNPTFTARGGVADIEVFDNDLHSLFEVTLMRGKQQAITEIPAITRHLNTVKNENKFAVFIAPFLHADTKYMIAFTRSQYDLKILGYTIIDFCKTVSSISDLESFSISR